MAQVTEATPAGALPDAPEAGGRSTPAWTWAASLVLVALGLGDSIYLTWAHYTSTTALACPDTGVINCAKVTTSSYSHILGIPVAVLGLVFFVGIVPLVLPVAWRSTWAPLRAARLLGTGVGVAMVVWLLVAELFRLHALCLYCTGVHIVTVLLFFVTVFGTLATSPDPE